MRIKAGERSFELGWREIAILLALLWTKSGALLLSHFRRIEPDSGKLNEIVEKLKTWNLIGEVPTGKARLLYLTDLGYNVAKQLEKMAKDLEASIRETNRLMN
ncbi:MAG: hypothetical protein QW291_02385 [Thermofilaceae archaeon]